MSKTTESKSKTTESKSKSGARAATLRENLARELGVDVTTVAPRWVELLKEGVIVRVHIKRWRGKTRLTLGDMGLASGDSRATKDETLGGLLSLGEKKLLPPSMLARLDSLDTLARRAVSESGFSTYWGVFVPATAYESLAKRLNEYRDEYLATRDEIVSKRDEIVAQMRAEYRIAAQRAYTRLSVLDPTSVKGIGETDFVRAFCDAVVALIPSGDVISESFGFDVELSYVPLPSMLASDIKRAESLTLDRDALDDKRRKLAAMNDAVVADARKKKDELLDGFLKDVTTQTRALLYDAATSVLDSLKSGESLHARSVVQLRRLVSRLSALNFTDDADVKRMGELVAKAIESKADARNVDAIAQTLRDIATVTRSTLISLGADTPRESKHLSVDVAPTSVDVKRARKSLGLRELSALKTERVVESSADVAPSEIRRARSL